MSHDFDLIVIGGGAAGLVASKFAAGLRKRVALVEKSRLGGECTLYGCVPSKALISSAKAYYQANHADEKGFETCLDPPPTGEALLARVARVVERVYEGHKPDALEAMGIQVIFGNPRFLDNHRIQVDGTVKSAGSFIICTGTSPLIPVIEGIDRTPYLTNETLFDIKSLPRSMVLLGGGPIGIEMAQAFNSLGVTTTVIEAGQRILIREDKELSDLLAQRLVAQGMRIRTDTRVTRLGRKGDEVELTLEDAFGQQERISGERVLVAVGRKANVGGLDLEAAGVDYSPEGIQIDRKLRTSARNIYACGDVTGPYRFSHMAEYQARIAGQNALFPIKKRADYDNYLWCTFTDPEFAHAGLTEEEARRRCGDSIRIYKWACKDTDRGKTEAEEFGMAKFICDRSYRLVGAHILGSRAGELIHEAQIVKTLGIPFHRLDSIIHIYPSFSDVVKQPSKLCHIDKLRNSVLAKIAGTLLKGRR